MLFSYEECLNKFGSDYRLKQAIQAGDLYKIAKGIYSDKKEVTEISIVNKKYPKAVFTLNSAFYYHGLTDTIPSQYYLATDKDDSKIKDKKVKQIFDNNNSLKLGMETIAYEGEVLKIFSKERMLIELIRNKSKLPFDYYKEVLNNYRKMINDLDFEQVEEYAEKLPKTKLVLHAIQTEVF